MKRGIVTLGTLAAVLAIGWSAWTWWPPVLNWRLQQIHLRTERVMLGYLDGKQDLAPAARTLADLWKKGRSVRARMSPMRLRTPTSDPEFQARIMRVDERRLNVLLVAASQLMPHGPGWTTYAIERDSV